MIRWITEVLGTAPATSSEITPGLSVVDVRDLVDKGGNPAAAVLAKIEQGVRALEDGKRVVVCCDYGISRSNSVAAGILSVFKGVSFNDAVNTVSRATGEKEIKLEPLSVVREALRRRAGAFGSSAVSDGAPRILLTGGNGFIGTALQRRIGCNMFCIAPRRAECDVLAGATALDLLVKQHAITQIVHLANPRVYTSARAIGDMTTMLRNTLDVCRENGTRLVYLSGWEVFSGYRASDLLADESTPMSPKGPYGEAKYLCELLIDLYARTCGLNSVVVRPTPVYGPGGDRPKFIFNFLDKARHDHPIRTHAYRNGAPKLDFLHIDDLVEALFGLLNTTATGALHLGTGILTGTNDVARFLVEATNSGSAIDTQQIDADVANIRMDCTRARGLLNWYPTVSLQAGLASLIARTRVTS